MDVFVKSINKIMVKCWIFGHLLRSGYLISPALFNVIVDNVATEHSMRKQTINFGKHEHK